MKYCTICGTQLDDNAQYCSGCGNKLQTIESSNSSSKGTTHKRTKIIIVFVCFFVLAAIAVLSLFVFWSQNKPQWAKNIYNTFYSFSEDTSAISSASSSVILLDCYDKNGDLYATGSGFTLFEEGIIVTNYHVIEQDVYNIVANIENGTSFRIDSVLAYDEDLDIAILKTNASPDLSPLCIGATKALEKGENVVAIGSPLGLINSVSTGVYSGEISDDTMRLLQFTASISHGSSGGPLFNDAGEVIAITSGSFSEGQNVNLAIPIEYVEELWNENALEKPLSVPEFYETFNHTITVDYLLAHAEELDGQLVTVEGYVSYVFGYVSDGNLIQEGGIVSKEENVIGYTTVGFNWLDIYLHISKNRTSYDSIDGICLDFRIREDEYKGLESFFEVFSPHKFVVMTGVLHMDNTSSTEMRLDECVIADSY